MYHTIHKVIDLHYYTCYTQIIQTVSSDSSHSNYFQNSEYLVSNLLCIRIILTPEIIIPECRIRGKTETRSDVSCCRHKFYQTIIVCMQKHPCHLMLFAAVSYLYSSFIISSIMTANSTGFPPISCGDPLLYYPNDGLLSSSHPEDTMLLHV